MGKWTTLNFGFIVDYGFSLTCEPFTTIYEFYVLEAPPCQSRPDSRPDSRCYCVPGLGHEASVGFVP